MTLREITNAFLDFDLGSPFDWLRSVFRAALLFTLFAGWTFFAMRAVYVASRNVSSMLRKQPRLGSALRWCLLVIVPLSLLVALIGIIVN